MRSIGFATAAAAVGVGTLLAAGCSSPGRHLSLPQATSASNAPASTSSDTTTTSSTATLVVAAQPIPISVSSQLTTDQQDASVLAPSSCQLQGGVVTATGTLTRVLTEGYLRYGDVVELYAYNTISDPPTGINDIQVLALESEKPGILDSSTWTASAPVATGFPQPARCFVAVQSTHAFMGAGNAGS